MTGPLEFGQMVLLIDDKGRHYLVKLVERSTFQYHRGNLPHEDIIAAGDGGAVTASSGGMLRVLRPRLRDYILKMTRGAQVVYPKDIGSILVWADVAAGMTVLEAGTGSGALTTALLRAVGPTGRVVTVERRDDHARTAHKTLTRWFGEIPDNLEMRSGEVEEVLVEVAPERIVLDVPEPWHAARIAAEHQDPGGVLCCYLPTVPQIQTLVETLEETGAYEDTDVFETMERTWNVSGRSVRPGHRMIGHTGFLVTSRRVQRREGGP